MLNQSQYSSSEVGRLHDNLLTDGRSSAAAAGARGVPGDRTLPTRALMAAAVALALLFAPAGAHAAWSGPITVDSGAKLVAVACPLVNQCTAVAGGGAVTFNPGGGTSAAPVAIDGNDNLTAIACPSSTQCTAVDRTGAEVTFNPVSPGTQSPIEIDSVGIGQFDGGLDGIACPSVAQCTAVDAAGEAVTFAPSAPDRPPISGIDFQDANILGAVACPSAAQCTTGDQDGTVTTFTPLSPGSPPQVSIDVPTSDLTGIACPSRLQCTAVSQLGRVVTFNPHAPSAAPITLDGTALSAVACPSATFCVVVDRKNDSFEGDPQSRGAWTRDPISGASGLNAVACPSTTVCVAVDSRGNAFVGPDPVTAGSRAALSGLGTTRTRLTFSLQQPSGAQAIHSITIGAIEGVSFTASAFQLSYLRGPTFAGSVASLRRAITVTDLGPAMPFAASTRRGSVTLTLAFPEAHLDLALRNPALVYGKGVAATLRAAGVRTLEIPVTVTDTSHHTTNLVLFVNVV
jgi:hypothetical protein